MHKQERACVILSEAPYIREAALAAISDNYAPSLHTSTVSLLCQMSAEQLSIEGVGHDLGPASNLLCGAHCSEYNCTPLSGEQLSQIRCLLFCSNFPGWCIAGPKMLCKAMRVKPISEDDQLLGHFFSGQLRQKLQDC